MERKNKLTQCEKVLRHFLKVGPLTAAEAMRFYGIMRLASRVSDLRRAGYPVEDKFVCSKNAFGETVHYKKYWMDESKWLEGSGSYDKI